MGGGINARMRADETVVSDGDRAHVQNNHPCVGVKMVPHRNVAAIITVKTGLYIKILPCAAEELRQQGRGLAALPIEGQQGLPA